MTTPTQPDVMEDAVPVSQMFSELEEADDPNIEGADLTELSNEAALINVPVPRFVVRYRTDTGHAVAIDRMQLRSLMQMRYPNGMPVFTSEPVEVAKGSILCILHPQHPMRPVWDTMGLPICTKGNFFSQYDADIHVRRTHKHAFEAIESYKKADKDRVSAERDQAIVDLVRTFVELQGGSPVGVQDES